MPLRIVAGRRPRARPCRRAWASPCVLAQLDSHVPSGTRIRNQPSRGLTWASGAFQAAKTSADEDAAPQMRERSGCYATDIEEARTWSAGSFAAAWWYREPTSGLLLEKPQLAFA